MTGVDLYAARVRKSEIYKNKIKTNVSLRKPFSHFPQGLKHKLFVMGFKSNRREKIDPRGNATAHSSEGHNHKYIHIMLYLYLPKKNETNITWMTVLFFPKN